MSLLKINLTPAYSAFYSILLGAQEPKSPMAVDTQDTHKAIDQSCLFEKAWNEGRRSATLRTKRRPSTET